MIRSSHFILASKKKKVSRNYSLAILPHHVKSIFQIAAALKSYLHLLCVYTNTGPNTHTHWSWIWVGMGLHEGPSAPCGLLLAKPLLISLTTLAIFSTVIINHPSPLLSPLLLYSTPLSTLPPPTSPLFASSTASFLLSSAVQCSSICVRAAVMR